MVEDGISLEEGGEGGGVPIVKFTKFLQNLYFYFFTLLTISDKKGLTGPV